MPALYPVTVAPEDFKVGDCVKRWISDRATTSYSGIVTNICPSIYKVDVQWPMGNVREDPEFLVRVNPIFGLPSVKMDSGYSSYDKGVSEKFFGKIPSRLMPSDKMYIRVAHTFATEIIGNLVDEVSSCVKQGMTDLQTYNKVYGKFGSICSDHILKSTIKKFYKGEK
jgi:hypothetical protein